MSEALHTYLLMGGYAPFIWPAYGIAALILAAFAVDSWRRVDRATADLRRLEAEIALTARPAKTGSSRSGSGGNKTAAPTVSAQPDQQVGS
jgi:heme exporter protein D